MTAPKTSKPAGGGWAATMERLRKRPLPQSVLRICDEPGLRDAVEKAEQGAKRARLLAEATPESTVLASRAEQAEDHHRAAEAKLATASITLTFRALPRPALEELIGEHPPSEEQAKDGAGFNSDTFPPVLVSAASVDGMTVEEAGELLGSWSSADANALWEAAWRVQQETRADVGKG